MQRAGLLVPRHVSDRHYKTAYDESMANNRSILQRCGTKVQLEALAALQPGYSPEEAAELRETVDVCMLERVEDMVSERPELLLLPALLAAQDTAAELPEHVLIVPGGVIRAERDFGPNVSVSQVIRASSAYYGSASWFDDVATYRVSAAGQQEVGYAQLRALIRIPTENGEQSWNWFAGTRRWEASPTNSSQGRYDVVHVASILRREFVMKDTLAADGQGRFHVSTLNF